MADSFDTLGVDAKTRVGVETTDMYVRVVFEYEDGETRTYELHFPQPIDSQAVAAAKAVVIAINDATDSDFDNFFMSDLGGKFMKIKSAELRSVTEETVW